MLNATPCIEWVRTRIEAPVVGMPAPVYVTLCPAEGPRAYPQRARIPVDGLPASVACERLAAEISDLAESRAAEDRPLVKLRVHLYGPKGLDELGCRTFVVGDVADRDELDLPGGREGELVASLRELRLALGQANDTARAMAAGAFATAQVALQGQRAALDRISVLETESAEQRAAVIVAEAQASNPIRELLELAGPLMPLLAARLAPPALPPPPPPPPTKRAPTATVPAPPAVTAGPAAP